MRYQLVLPFLAASISLPALGAPTITPDATTVGALTSVTGNGTYQISGGKLVGGKNQFLSFGQFGLNTGNSATFSGPAGIQNILARVTGGTASNIDGTITSTIAGANLFLLNPSGVMFGAHAQVNVSGAFSVSTANYLQMMDNTKFYADTVNAAINDGNLSSSSVASFGFLSTNTSAITANGTTLSVPGGLQIISGAGGVSLTNAKLSVSSGVLGVFAGTPNGTNDGLVPYLTLPGQSYSAANGLQNFNTAGTADSVTLANSTMGSGAGGNVVIRGGMLVSLDSTSTIRSASGGASSNGISLQADVVSIQGQVGSTASLAAHGGDVAITSTTSTTIDGGSVTSATSGTGAGGDVTVSSPALTLQNGGAISSSSTDDIDIIPTGGNAGNINVTTTGATSLAAGTQILSFTSGTGNAGSVSVNAASVSVVGSGTATPLSGNVTVSNGLLMLNGSTPLTGIFAASGSGATGGAGAVTVVSTGALGLSEDGQIGSLSAGSGLDAAGSVMVTAQPVTTGTLSLASGAEISSVTTGSQAGATVTVTADDTTAQSLTIDGSGSGIFTAQTGSGAIGAPGAVQIISLGTIALTNQAQIYSSTHGNTTGGAVNVSASALNLQDSGTKIYTVTTGSQSAGSLQINSALTAGSVDLMAGTQIISIGGAGGSAGDVSVYADDSGTIALTIASSAGISSGNAASVTVDSIAGDISNSGNITAGSGTVSVDATSGMITTSGQIRAGTVSVITGSLTDSGTLIATGGGGVTVTATDTTGTALSLSGAGSGIFSQGMGPIMVTSSGAASLSAGGQIDATGGGTVTVIAQDTGANSLNISGTGSGIFSRNSRALTVTSSGTLTLANQAQISSSTSGSVTGGAVTVSAAALSLQDSGTEIDTSTLGVQAAGSLTINNSTLTTDSVALGAGTEIISTTAGQGSAGSVTVHDSTLTLTGSGTGTPQTGIFSESNTTGLGFSGNAGTVSVISASDLSISGGAQIASLSTGPTDPNNISAAGSVTVEVDSGTLAVMGTGSGTTSEQAQPVIYSFAANPYASSGNVNINAFGTNGNTTIVNLSQNAAIETYTDNAGVESFVNNTPAPTVTPGNVTVQAGILNISGNSAIQSLVAPDVSAGGTILSGASTGTVTVQVTNSVTIGNSANDTGWIDTIANSATTGPGTGTAGDVTVIFGGGLTENTASIAPAFSFTFGSTTIGFYSTPPEKGFIISSNPTPQGGSSPSPLIVHISPFSTSAPLGPPPSPTDVVLNGFGGSGTALGSNNIFDITPSDGTLVGDNLFLSFSSFNLINFDEIADFQVPSSGIENILVRVTGGASTINGLLEETIGSTTAYGDANLYFLNPSGITFGANSAGNSVKLDGSFTVSTANQVELSSGGTFTTLPSANDSLIVPGANAFSGSVSGFDFTSIPGAISFNHTSITTAVNADLQVIGGDITVDNSNLSAPGGAILLFSGGGSGGTIDNTPDLQDVAGLGDTFGMGDHGSISISDSTIKVQAQNTENISSTLLMRGDSLSLSDNSNIVDESQATMATAGNLIIDMDSSISLTSTLFTAPAIIQTSNIALTGDSTGGNIELDAQSITIEGASSEVISTAQPLVAFNSSTGTYYPIIYNSSSLPTGASGNVTLDVGQVLTIDGGQIAANTYGAGSGGSINITGSAAITIEDGGRITSDSVLLTSAQTSIFPNLTSTQFTDYLTDHTFTSTGNAGNISLAGSSLTINGDGLPQPQFTGISSSAGNLQSSPTDLTGNGGTVTLSIGQSPGVTNGNGSITIENGGQIAAAAFAAGNAGSVSVTGGALTIDGDGLVQPQFTGISTSAGSPADADTDPTGNGGNISVTVDGNDAASGTSGGGDITILNGGQISASSFTHGLGGTITVAQANSLDAQGISINGAQEQQATGILADSYGTGSASINNLTGVTVSVTANGAVSLLAGGEISSGTFDNSSLAGNGGDLSLTITPGGSLTINGSGGPTIHNRNGDFLSTGVLSSTYGSANAGRLSVNVTGPVDLAGGGAISDGSFYGSGTGGTLSVTILGSLTIDGTGTPIFDQNFDFVPTGIITSSFFSFSGQSGAGNAGNGATVDVTGPVSIRGGGQISSGSLLGGNGGSLGVTITGSLAIDGSTTPSNFTGLFFPTGILSSTIEGGNAGPETVTVNGPVSITGGGQISSGTFYGGSGGDLALTINSGSLSISGSAVPLDGSGVAEFNTGVLSSTVYGDNAGNMTVIVNGPVSIAAGGQISSETNGGGAGGTLYLNIDGGTLSIDGLGAPSTTVDQFSSSPILLQTGILSSSLGNGGAGDASVVVSGGVDLTAGGQISSGTTDLGNGSGKGGNLVFESSSLTIDGSGSSAGSTGIFSTTSLLSGAGAGTNEGNAGVVSLLVAGSIDLVGGGQISSGTTSTGTAGTVNLYAGSLMIDGASSAVSTSSSGPASATGSGGAINLSVSGAIALGSGGQINATTSTDQTGGSINIGGESSNQQNLGSAGSVALTGIGSAITADTSGSGNAGDVDLVVTGSVGITDGSQISSGTTGTGTAGTVNLDAGSLAIDGSYATAPTGISTSSAGPSSATGHGGAINLSVPGLITLSGGGQINATTSTGQIGGSINIGGLSSGQSYLAPAGDLTLSGTGSAITAAASGAGDGGNISITTGGVLTETDLATITCSSLESNAGNLTITANDLIMQNGASIDTTASAFALNASSPVGNGGNITIHAGTLVYLLDSDILTRATNTGGNITIDPEFVVLGSSVISAAGAFGDGNILITASYVLGSSSTIIATGTVSIDSLPLNLAGSLIALPGQLTDDEKRLRESCARSINHEFSSLIVVGRGGTETGPQELSPDFGMTEDPAYQDVSEDKAGESMPAQP